MTYLIQFALMVLFLLYYRETIVTCSIRSVLTILFLLYFKGYYDLFDTISTHHTILVAFFRLLLQTGEDINGQL